MTHTTNDAPVTVEQCDRDAAHWVMLAMHGDDWLGLLNGDEDQHPLVQSHARHRLAALASAPAGDGTTVEFVREWLMSGDHPVSDWERQFAAAIDARPRAAGLPAKQVETPSGGLSIRYGVSG